MYRRLYLIKDGVFSYDSKVFEMLGLGNVKKDHTSVAEDGDVLMETLIHIDGRVFARGALQLVVRAARDRIVRLQKIDLSSNEISYKGCIQ